MDRICEWHHCNNTVQSRGRFCSYQCKNKFSVDQRRKDLKKLAIEYKGGACKVCGYNKCQAAFDFHHLDPAQKDFGLSSNGITRSWDKVKQEIEKCILVCCRCHREIHEGEHQEILTNYAKELALGLHLKDWGLDKTNRVRSIKNYNRKDCLTCHGVFYPNSSGQSYCSKECYYAARRVKRKEKQQANNRKVKDRPSKEELIAMRKTMSWCAIGRKYGVSDNAIRKWMR